MNIMSNMALPIILLDEGKETNNIIGIKSRRFTVGQTTWWLYESFVPELHKNMFCLYGHSSVTGYVGKGTITLVEQGCSRVLREARDVTGTGHGPDVWYASSANELVWVKASSR
jgi:hypothetical protein